MSQLIDAVIHSEEQSELRLFISELRAAEKRYLLRNDVLQVFASYCAKHHGAKDLCKTFALGRLINYTQEIILEAEGICLIVRPKIAHQEAFWVGEDLTVEPLSIRKLLDLRDRFADHYRPLEGDLLEIDFGPFYDYSPKIRDPKHIGKGVQFLNRYLSSKLFSDSQEWLDGLFNFLSLHRYEGLQLLINERITGQHQLSDHLQQAIDMVDTLPADAAFATFRFKLQDLGFEPGWGNTATRVKETLEMLGQLLDSPDHQVLEAFLSRIPMIFKIALISPHGWFGQEGVLGKPDTGGQVVYVLDQARSLDQQLKEDIRLAGLDVFGVEQQVIILTRLIPNSEGTLCNQRLEKVHASDNAWILRVPFREFNPQLTQHWISRMEIWGYLETFAVDAEKELQAEFQGRPDLIIGNYSDGNLVAFLIARSLGVTQFNIAHALEKTKYLFSNLYWQEMEEEYHFSLQFTADIIAMNAANCIITSTYQEIVGTPDSVGQYESCKCFTMPDLYHVFNGIELFSPKFNVVPPAVNESFFFPYTRHEDRMENQRERLEAFLFTQEDPDHIWGQLDEPHKRPLFSMARLDRMKNLPGLVECFGRSPELQERCNLILIAGKLRVDQSADREEITGIETIHHLIEEYNLYGKFRWLGAQLSKGDTGEVYRIIADRQGIFVQPALFEAFGLTILESMISGLPIFATQFGGPLEIIQDRVNGFHINPTQPEKMAHIILQFLEQCDRDSQYWHQISRQGIDRVYSSYTWSIHTTRLLSMARIYGFWNYISKEEREDLLRYLEALFYLLYKPRSQQLLDKHLNS